MVFCAEVERGKSAAVCVCVFLCWMLTATARVGVGLRGQVRQFVDEAFGAEEGEVAREEEDDDEVQDGDTDDEGGKDWMWSTRLPVPPVEAEQTLYYLCDGHCGGLGDRLIGMLNVYLLSVLTHRSFRVVWSDPGLAPSPPSLPSAWPFVDMCCAAWRVSCLVRGAEVWCVSRAGS